MVTSFLAQVADHLLATYHGVLDEVAVVLPNRRAGLFLRHHLASRISAPVWMPTLFSTEEFVASLSQYAEASPVRCLTELFEIHCATEGEKAQSFADFLNWAPQLLNDFNEIDRYLANPEHLFNYLDEVRAMTVWNPENQPLTEFQLNYLRFYHSLLTYYRELTARLTGHRLAIPGMIYRDAWTRLQDGSARIPFTNLIFAGFNALTTSEERIIHHLVSEGKAEILWDTDRYYLNDPRQEAGEFLRKWFAAWPNQTEKWVYDQLLTGNHAITVNGVPGVTGQVKLAGDILADLLRDGVVDEHTAVVLPDERLLLPLLNSIPAGIEAVNITMGLPLSQTPMAGLIDQVIRMHLTTLHMDPAREQAGRYYFREVITLLQNPFVNRLATRHIQGNRFAYQELLGSLRSGKQVFVGKEEMIPAQMGLFTAHMDFLDLLFVPWPSVVSAFQSLKNLLDELVKVLLTEDPAEAGMNPGSGNRFDLEVAWGLARALQQLAEVDFKTKDYLTVDVFAQLLGQLFETTRLPFYGEPLLGLQVMGMLETRVLDFDRLIILSCNEGILPAGRTGHSFIPYDVKRDFNLPLFHQNDAIYAYHFYRLLQRAGQVWLIYNTESDPLGGGEPSRFIRQISQELSQYNPAITISRQYLTSPLPLGQRPDEILIPKESGVWERLLGKAEKGLAPTALNAFRSCSLRFYFSEIAGIREPDEPAEEIDPRTLGSAVHEALQTLYKPLLKQIVTVWHIGKMEEQIREVVGQAFRKHFSGERLTTGKNRLLVEVARLMIRRFLSAEKQYLDSLSSDGHTLTLRLLEHPLKRSVSIPVNGKSLPVLVKGFVDRVDQAGHTMRIIDYKTGSVDPGSELTVKDWESLQSEPALDKGFQLLTYAWLFAGAGERSSLQAGIISLKQQSRGMMPVKVPAGEAKTTPILDGEVLNDFENQLTILLSRMFDPSEPFMQTSDPERCLHCPYQEICTR